MTADQALVLSQIKRHPMAATDLAHLIGWPVESVYVELVSLEAQGLARVVIGYSGGRVISREWEAM